MERVRHAAADLLLGSRCVGCQAGGPVLCAPCRAQLPREAQPAWPTPTPPGLAPPWAAGEYADLLRDLVVAHKEHRVWALRTVLGEVLAVSVRAAAAAGHPVVLVPMPSRSAATRSRGHDPTAGIVATAARRLRAEGREVRAVPLLRVAAAVADQAGLDAGERAANLSGSLGYRPRALGELRRWRRRVLVCLCDDVITTGATAREGQRVLEAIGLPVAGIATVAATRRRLPPGVRNGAAVLPVSPSTD